MTDPNVMSDFSALRIFMIAFLFIGIPAILWLIHTFGPELPEDKIRAARAKRKAAEKDAK